MRNLWRYSSLVWELVKIWGSKQPRKDLVYRKTIFYTLKDWGGVYIKFLQTLAGMSKFMEGWGGPQEMAVFAQAPREPIDLAKYLDCTKFQNISTEPVAAGSFALVFRGTLLSGEDVAIKILRPSICDNLQKDLAALRRLCWLVTRFLPQSLVNYNEAYESCAEMFALETDYQREMANQEYFYELYKNNSQVVIPKIYKALSNQHVIVQDFIDGPTLADVMGRIDRSKTADELTKELTGSNLWTQIVTAGGEALYQAMCADYVYGDPHPGNIVLLSDNRIGFIDFGMIAGKPTSHTAFYNWVKSYREVLLGQDSFPKMIETTVTCFCPDISIAMQRCNFSNGSLLNILAQAVSEKIGNEVSGDASYAQTFRNGHLMTVLLQVVSTKVIALDVKSLNFELLKAMQAFLGAVTILDNMEQRQGFSNLMLHAMDYAITKAEQAGVKADLVNTTSLSITESYELLVNTISSLADNDEFMFNFVKERIFA